MQKSSDKIVIISRRVWWHGAEFLDAFGGSRVNNLDGNTDDDANLPTGNMREIINIYRDVIYKYVRELYLWFRTTRRDRDRTGRRRLISGWPRSVRRVRIKRPWTFDKRYIIIVFGS